MSVTIKGINKSTEVGRIGYGCMSLTTKPGPPIPDEQAFEAIKTAIDNGSTFLNAGQFYGGEKNLELLNRFFTKYPEYADKTVLSVKGAFDLATFQADCSTDGLRKSVLRIREILGGTKKLDLFQPARVDPKVPIEQVMKDLKAMVEEGLFDYVGLSECSANTIRKAHAVFPISVLEEEYSPFSLDMERNEVLATCKELGIPIAAYSPIGKGLLSGEPINPNEFHEGDFRKHLDKLNGENWEINQVIVQKFNAISAKKGIAPSQLSLAWILKQWPEGFIPIPGSSRPKVVGDNLKALGVTVNDEEDKEIREVVGGVKGGRTARPQIISDEQAFEAIKAAIDAGSTFLNSAEFYGPPTDGEANLKLLNRFFTKYPEYAPKCILSVKGAFNMKAFQHECSTEGLRKSVLRITELLGGKKRLDVFAPARIDPNVPIEDMMKDLKAMVDEGLFDYVGLSECSANTIKRAHAVCPISVLEEEYNPISLDMEKNGVLATCKELSIPITVYSPLGKGLLSGEFTKPTDLQEGDFRLRFDRFQTENWDTNYALITKFKKIAEQKGVTPALLSLAWILRQWPEGFIPIPGSSRPDVVVTNLKALEVALTDEEDEEIRSATAGVVGGRYGKFAERFLSV
ncbi:Aldo/keto reductase [Atractiella rhizophila]|nr:Aldo/keto reductase [Atractiella rhizophila]